MNRCAGNLNPGWNSIKGSSKRDQYGFSYMEMVIVIIILGILTTIAGPSLKRSVASYQLRGASNSIKSQLQLARALAMGNPSLHSGVYFDTTSGHIARIFFDKNGNNQYNVGDSLHRVSLTMPAGFQLAWPSGTGLTNDCIVFRGDGSTKAGIGTEIIVQSKNFNTVADTINILPSTGRVKVK